MPALKFHFVTFLSNWQRSHLNRRTWSRWITSWSGMSMDWRSRRWTWWSRSHLGRHDAWFKTWCCSKSTTIIIVVSRRKHAPIHQPMDAWSPLRISVIGALKRRLRRALPLISGRPTQECTSIYAGICGKGASVERVGKRQWVIVWNFGSKFRSLSPRGEQFTVAAEHPICWVQMLQNLCKLYDKPKLYFVVPSHRVSAFKKQSFNAKTVSADLTKIRILKQYVLELPVIK